MAREDNTAARTAALRLLARASGGPGPSEDALIVSNPRARGIFFKKMCGIGILNLVPTPGNKSVSRTKFKSCRITVCIYVNLTQNKVYRHQEQVRGKLADIRFVTWRCLVEASAHVVVLTSTNHSPLP